MQTEHEIEEQLVNEELLDNEEAFLEEEGNFLNENEEIINEDEEIINDDEEIINEDELIENDALLVLLKEYHRKQLIENLVGPGVSLVFHLFSLTLMFLLIVTQPNREHSAFVVQMTEMDEVEIEEEILEEIEEIEDELTDEIVDDRMEAPSETNEASEDSLVDVSDDAPMTNDDVDAEEYLDVVRNDSPLTYAGALGGRTAGGRAGLTRKYGGGMRGQRSVNKALKWLSRVQKEDGSWDGLQVETWDENVAVPAATGLALLVFLAHGETPLSEEYGPTVQRAMQWLANYANRENLNEYLTEHRDKIGGQGLKPYAYSHGIAAYAIGEAAAMTNLPFMSVAMEKAIKIIIDGQMENGGFGYSYTQARWDLSVAGWQMQALKAARMAGCTNPGLDKAIKKSIYFLTEVCPCESKFLYTGMGKYVPRHPMANMTGVGAVCLQLLGAGSETAATRALSTIRSERLELYKDVAEKSTRWNEIGGANLYGWYYDTQAVFNAQSLGGGKVLWKLWRPVFEKVLVRAQNIEGYWETNGDDFIGSADTPGRVLATALAALQLQVYYRYLPTFDIKKEPEPVDQDAADIGT